jgi:N6-adenosine-specific RNA methylase IME4
MTNEVLHKVTDELIAFHPACLLLPRMTDEEYAALRASIRLGFDGNKPIELFENRILDGRHRYRACRDEGITPKYITIIGVDPYEHVRNVHEGRRSWQSQEQKALVIGDLIEKSDGFKAEQKRIRDEANAKRIQAAVVKTEEHEKVTVVPQIEARLLPESVKKTKEEPKKPERATAIKAEKIGVSRAAVERAQTIKKHSPAMAEKVAQGDMTASEAIREIKKTTIVERLETVAAREIEAPTGLYDVIVIDPPWDMQKIERDVRPNQVAFDYPTMSEEELSSLAIPADEHCHVWVWTTHKFLPMALRLLDTWKLKYVCTFVWHKPGGFQPIGLPQYNSEFAIYARKGSPSFIDTKAFNTCFNAPRGAHSEKPEEFYDVVRRVTGGRRLDMFSRREIDGFATWGKEAAA